MDFERQFWDEQTPITPQELNRIESGIESLYKRPRIYTGSLYIELIEMPRGQVRTYTVSCPGARPWHIALASYSHRIIHGEVPLLVQAKAQYDEVAVRVENITDYAFGVIGFTIYVVALDFDDLFGIDPN